MEVILLILKIIGIVLLSLIGLVLLFGLLLLFWPFSYRLKVHKDAEELNGAIRILWLLGLLTATVDYNGEVWLKVRVIGIPVFKYQIWPQPETEETGGTDSLAAEEDQAIEGDNSTLSKTENNENVEESNIDNAEQTSDDEEYFQMDEECEMFTDDAIEQKIDEVIDEEEEEAFANLPIVKKIKAFLLKIKEFILKCREKCYNIKSSIEQNIRKVKRIYKNIEHYYKLLQHPSIKPAWNKLWFQLKRIIKHIRPRKVKANIEFGTGDPASTMRVYGYYCMIYPFYGKQIIFTPDMEDKVFNLDATVSGRMQVFQVMRMSWSLFIDKHVRRVVRLIIREVRRLGRK